MIRPYDPSDRDAVVEVWLRSGREEYHYLPDFQALTTDGALQVFREIIEPLDLRVAVDGDTIVGFLAMADHYVDRLYVDPAAQGLGWGSRLLAQAKETWPDHLELHTHQANRRARAFYEQRGLVAVELGISPPPESVPDVRYRWTGHGRA